MRKRNVLIIPAVLSVLRYSNVSAAKINTPDKVPVPQSFIDRSIDFLISNQDLEGRIAGSDFLTVWSAIAMQIYGRDLSLVANGGADILYPIGVQAEAFENTSVNSLHNEYVLSDASIKPGSGLPIGSTAGYRILLLDPGTLDPDLERRILSKTLEMSTLLGQAQNPYLSWRIFAHRVIKFRMQNDPQQAAWLDSMFRGIMVYRNPDQGWPIRQGFGSDLDTTAHALYTLRVSSNNFFSGKQNPDGGYGTLGFSQGSNVDTTAIVCAAKGWDTRSLSFIQSRQKPSGAIYDARFEANSSDEEERYLVNQIYTTTQVLISLAS